MHRVSSPDQQTGTTVGASSEEEDQSHNEGVLSSSLDEVSSSNTDGDLPVPEGDPQYLRRHSVTDEGRRWQLKQAFLFPFELVGEVVRIIMNAAVTIFGMGVGVGLILGDSFRPSSVDGAAGEGATDERGSDATSHNLASSLGATGGSTRREEGGVESESLALSRPSLSDLPPQ